MGLDTDSVDHGRHRVRPFRDDDREAIGAFGASAIDWWHSEVEGASLHLVAEDVQTGAVVGHLQARDRGVPAPSRRAGQVHFTLLVAPSHRAAGVGSDLYERLEAFARERGAVLLYGSYTGSAEAPAARFLEKRGFVLLERFLPSCLDLCAFDPADLSREMERVERLGIRLITYTELGDSPENRRRLYSLEEDARSAQPFREVSAYVPSPFERWLEEFSARDLETLFVAVAPTGEFVGVVTALEWGFTGVRCDWRGRGIATALKVRVLAEAKARGIERLETENHEDNLAMLAINRRLGFVLGDPEAVVVKVLSEKP